jgi:peptidoglycan/xylan/chitin deacetylase (PgdA/CDA1 family)
MRVVLSAALSVAAMALYSCLASAAVPGCANPNALGVSRTVEIDTTGGPGFGMEHYKAYDFLQPKEVVLTFDDGPQKFSTEMVLAALAEQCTKATFFSIGKMALGYPEIIREVAKAGHTIGTHTWSHQALAKLKTPEEGKDEIERGISAVKRAVGGPVAPFFRFPTLVDTPAAVSYLGTRNIAMFSTDIDSFDFKPQPAENIVKVVLAKLEKNGNKGIVLMHDIHKTTAKALPMLLVALKEKGYKIVHLKAKGEVKTLAEYDAAIEKDAKGLPQVGAERPTSSIVKTIEGEAPAGEGEAAEPATPAPQGKASEKMPATPASPVAAAVPVAAPVQQPVAAAIPSPASGPSGAVAQKAASPVSTVPTTLTTSSIADDQQSAAGSGPISKPESVDEPVGAAPKKSFMEKAKAVWEMWFGK